MSIFGDLSGLAGSYESEGERAYTRGAIIQAGVLGGASANATQQALIDAGVGFRRANFLNVWEQAQDQYLPAQRSGSLAIDASTGAVLPGTPPPDWTGQIVHQVTVTWREKETDGSWSIHSKPYATIAQEFLTPAQAVEDVLGILATPQSPDEKERYPLPTDVLSMTLTGAWYRTDHYWRAGL